MSVHKVGSLIQNVRVRGFDELKIRSVLRYMTDLKIENNEEIGHYGQILNSLSVMSVSEIIDNLNRYFNFYPEN
jgi:hypothetical protein